MLLTRQIASSSRSFVARRAFTSAAVRSQAVPTQEHGQIPTGKKPLNKVFKIYRWVCVWALLMARHLAEFFSVG
jgi:hypothetical protein